MNYQHKYVRYQYHHTLSVSWKHFQRPIVLICKQKLISLCFKHRYIAKNVDLQNENQSLQNNLSTLKDQIEKLNISEYQKRIDSQNKELKDKDKYITMLKNELVSINVNQLQGQQIEKVLNLLKKTIDVSE
ncbi:Hypothetical_protein [Hexamita inflata]|uniref:Hypothetical_protein n=1 Tax=Hexamita inflata TaxID=28002 RepID=A0AA86RNW6_9EUKA|nr:Hypothetical protein HINF_LOCUS62947 [Hexamita inflata]